MNAEFFELIPSSEHIHAGFALLTSSPVTMSKTNYCQAKHDNTPSQGFSECERMNLNRSPHDPEALCSPQRRPSSHFENCCIQPNINSSKTAFDISVKILNFTYFYMSSLQKAINPFR